MQDNPTPRPPEGAARPTGTPARAAAQHDGARVVEDVQRALAELEVLPPDQQVDAYQDLEKALRDTLRTAGEDT